MGKNRFQGPVQKRGRWLGDHLEAQGNGNHGQGKLQVKSSRFRGYLVGETKNTGDIWVSQEEGSSKITPGLNGCANH